jgi:hypothetical protein
MNFTEIQSIRAKYLNPDPLSFTFQPGTKELLPLFQTVSHSGHVVKAMYVEKPKRLTI